MALADSELIGDPMTSPINREQLASAVRLLRGTVSESDALLQIDPDVPVSFYTPGSQAEPDTGCIGSDLVDDMLAHVNLLLVASLDHADCLATWGEGALDGRPTPIFPIWSVARSVVEACATVRWLLDESISERIRAERALTEQMVDARSQWVDSDDGAARKKKIEEYANSLDLKRTDERFVTYFGDRPQSRNELVSLLLPGADGFDQYSLMSGISHSEPWAIQSVGFTSEEDPDSPGNVRMMKTYKPEYLFLATMITRSALDRATKALVSYRSAPAP